LVVKREGRVRLSRQRVVPPSGIPGPGKPLCAQAPADVRHGLGRHQLRGVLFRGGMGLRRNSPRPLRARSSASRLRRTCQSAGSPEAGKPEQAPIFLGRKKGPQRSVRIVAGLSALRRTVGNMVVYWPSKFPRYSMGLKTPRNADTTAALQRFVTIR